MLKIKTLLSAPLIKINACLIGYGLWVLLGHHQQLTTHVQVPVCFYQTDNSTSIQAPEYIQATLQAPRAYLQFFNPQNSAIHLNAAELHPGKNYIFLKKENLFLPDKINLVNLVPSKIIVTLKKEA